MSIAAPVYSDLRKVFCFYVASLRHFGGSEERRVPVLGRLEGIWNQLGCVLGTSWAVLGASWGVLEPSWGGLWASWARLVPVLGPLEFPHYGHLSAHTNHHNRIVEAS